jgi:TRAP-type uncharacterized transport system substrate-binding protein
VLEVASEIVDQPEWRYRQARVNLREQGGDGWPIALFGSDSPAAIAQVASGEVQVAMINPAAPLALALRGKGPFREPIALRAIAVVPSPDQLAFAVTKQTGVQSLRELRERRLPLRVSIRGQMDHSLHLVVKEVLSAAGFSLEDITSWGGQVRYDPGLPKGPNRLGAMQRGEVDMIIDEAVHNWLNVALESEMHVLPLDESMLTQFETLGFQRAVLPKADYPKLDSGADFDFSGSRSTPTQTCRTRSTAVRAALKRGRKNRLARTRAAAARKHVPRHAGRAVNIPLHSAAERFWRERGYLK